MVLVIFSSCNLNYEEISTNNATEAYEYWSGSKHPNDLKLINGNYWQSNHFTLEFILELEFVAPQNWIDEFVKQNNFIVDKSSFNPDEVSDWFKPSANSIKYKHDHEFSDQGSRLYVDTLTNKIFLYEIQL